MSSLLGFQSLTGDDTENRQWQAVALCPDGRKDAGSFRHGAHWVHMLLAPVCLTMLRSQCYVEDPGRGGHSDPGHG